MKLKVPLLRWPARSLRYCTATRHSLSDRPQSAEDGYIHTIMPIPHSKLLQIDKHILPIDNLYLDNSDNIA